MMENKTFRWIAFAVSAVLAVIAIFAHTFSGFLCFAVAAFIPVNRLFEKLDSELDPKYRKRATAITAGIFLVCGLLAFTTAGSHTSSSQESDSTATTTTTAVNDEGNYHNNNDDYDRSYHNSSRNHNSRNHNGCDRTACSGTGRNSGRAAGGKCVHLCHQYRQWNISLSQLFQCEKNFRRKPQRIYRNTR